MQLIEKDFESEYNNDWKRVDDSPDFDSVESAREWLVQQGVEHFDQYRII